MDLIKRTDKLMSISIAQSEFSVCKAEEGDVAVATLTDDNAVDGSSGKQLVWISACRYTNHVKNFKEGLQ